MGPALGIHVLADDLAVIVDAEGLGSPGARDIDLGEDAILQQEPVGQVEGRRIALLAVCADDLPLSVDPRRRRSPWRRGNRSR